MNIQLYRYFSSFILSGIIIFLYFVFNKLFNIVNEQLEWFLYISILCSTFIIFTFFLFIRNQIIYLVFLNLFSILFIFFFPFFDNFYLGNFIFLLLSIILVFHITEYNLKVFFSFNNFCKIIILFIISIITFKLFYWINIDQFLFKDFSNFSVFNLNSNFLSLLYFLFLITFLFVVTFLVLSIKSSNLKTNIFIKYWWIIPTFIFFLEAFSTYGFFSKNGGGAMVHWQVYIGTIELMKNNGILLWDVPSQYGFLSLITIYVMPFIDPWMKLYFLNSILNLIISLIIFKTIWNNGNFYWYIISILLTWACFFIISGGGLFGNIAATPSAGGLRYFWVILLLYLIVRNRNRDALSQLLIFLPVWIIGFFWSIESAFYVSAIISPIIFYNVFYPKHNNLIRFLYLFSFPIFFLFFLFLIILYYQINFNIFPDLFSFIEYAVSWKEGFLMSEKININGSLWLPLILLSFIILEFFDTKDARNKFILLSIFLGFWSILSYYINQSIDLVFLKQLSFYIFFIFLVINISKNKNDNIYYLSPIFIIIITFTFCNPSIYYHLKGVLFNQNYNLTKTEHIEIDQYHEILSKIKPGKISVTYIEPGRYLFYNSKNNYFDKNDNKIELLSNNIWFPLRPAVSLDPLKFDRRIVYAQRWLNRHPIKKGWIINSADEHWHHPYDKLIKEVLVNYSIIEEVYHRDLKAVLYEKK